MRLHLPLSLCSLFIAGSIFGQTSEVSILSVSPGTVAPNGPLTIQMRITNTGISACEPLSSFTCPRFYSMLGDDYVANCHPYPQESGYFGIRLEVHFLDSPDPVNTYYITDLSLPHALAPGETVVLTRTVQANLPPGHYRLALITLRHFLYAFTSRMLHSPADSLALGATADFTVASDTTPPSITLSGRIAAACSLWPPNGDMAVVGVVSASDTQSAVSVLKVDVASNDPTFVPGTDSAVEGSAPGPLTVKLRARRAGFGGDRIYRLAITAKDEVGNTAGVNTTCTVPHDQGKK
jgi:hypothetical protein